MQHGYMGRVIQTRAFFQNAQLYQNILNGLHALLGQVNLLGLFINRVIALSFFFHLSREFWNDNIKLLVQLAVTICRARDDQRCSRFIDQD